MDEKLNKSAQTNAVIEVISELMERNPELMALGYTNDYAKKFVSTLFVGVAQYRAPDMSFEDLSECFILALVDYMAKSQEMQDAGSDRLATAETVLWEGGAWTGKTST